MGVDELHQPSIDKKRRGPKNKSMQLQHKLKSREMIVLSLGMNRTATDVASGKPRGETVSGHTEISWLNGADWTRKMRAEN